MEDLEKVVSKIYKLKKKEKDSRVDGYVSSKAVKLRHLSQRLRIN